MASRQKRFQHRRERPVTGESIIGIGDHFGAQRVAAFPALNDLGSAAKRLKQRSQCVDGAGGDVLPAEFFGLSSRIGRKGRGAEVEHIAGGGFDRFFRQRRQCQKEDQRRNCAPPKRSSADHADASKDLANPAARPFGRGCARRGSRPFAPLPAARARDSRRRPDGGRDGR